MLSTTGTEFRFRSTEEIPLAPSRKSTLQWIRPPQQARTQEQLVRLLDAAEALLAEKGFADMSVAEVASRAGTSVAALYRRFPDKDGLLHALHERFCAEAFATADAALDPARWEGASLAAFLADAIAFLAEVFREREALDRALYQRALTDEVFRERSARLYRHVSSGMVALLLARRGEIRHPDPARAAAFAVRQVHAVLAEHVTARVFEAQPAPLSDDQLVAELTRSTLAYLGASAPASPSSEEIRS